MTPSNNSQDRLLDRVQMAILDPFVRFAGQP